VRRGREHLLTGLGFRFGTNGPHAARTMMLEDIAILFSHLPGDASKADYAREVVELNSLGKPTKRARELALRHLGILYGLDSSLAIFRAFHRLWACDAVARPVLALFVALARDPLLRGTRTFIASKRLGEAATRDELEKLLASAHQDRFSPASLKSFAQNVRGTWTQAGYLVGHSRKTRAQPVVTPTNIAFALFLGHLEGLSGQRLFTSAWMNLLPGSPSELEALANLASHRGLLVFLNSGGVKEVRFPDYLTPQEDQIRQEASRVV
jgi:hypothetical protein